MYQRSAASARILEAECTEIVCGRARRLDGGEGMEVGW